MYHDGITAVTPACRAVVFISFNGLLLLLLDKRDIRADGCLLFCLTLAQVL